ncbi:MAG: hypothetical protein IPJ34_15360 [Myxococcales bacterium]|nr:hypothetical protein [Myxococcales bacterium]
MRSARGLAGALVVLGTAFGLAAAPAPVVDHVCAADEGKATCPAGRVRFCAKDGSLAACACPPGASAAASKSTCVADGKPAPLAGCTIPDATLAKQLGVEIDLGSLEQPPLPDTGLEKARSEIAALGKKSSATATDLRRLGEAYEIVEGDEARSLGTLKATKALAEARARRDRAVDDGVTARRALVTQFPADPSVPAVRVALARALLRKASYAGFGPSVEPDRAAAREQLALVAARPELDVPRRDANFVLLELAVRAAEWSKALGFAEVVRKTTASKADADDPPYAAGAAIRAAQAKLALGDIDGGRRALDEAIGVAAPCLPRPECVVASAGARKVIASTYAALGVSARTLAPVLIKSGNLPRHDRVRPLVKLAALYSAVVTPACTSAAEEARAWEQVIP